MPCSWQRKFPCKRPATSTHHLHGMLPHAGLAQVPLHVGCGDRSVHRKAARQNQERLHAEEFWMAERRSDRGGAFDRGSAFASCRPGPGRGGLLQDGRRAAGLRGAADAGGRGCGGHTPRRRRVASARAASVSAPAQRGIVAARSTASGGGNFSYLASLSGKRCGKVSRTRVPPAPDVRSSPAPQRAARLCMLRRPRPVLAPSAGASPSAASAKPLPSSAIVMQP